MLEYETFVNGLTFIMKCYKNFEFDKEEVAAWYHLIQEEIDEDAFLPLVMKYCKTESAPERTSDIINFARKMMVDAALSPENFVQAFINAIEQMQKDTFMYSDPSIEEQKDYVLWNIFARHPECRIDFVNDAVKDKVHEYFNSLYEAVRCGNTTTLSILCSEIKTKYSERLFASAGQTIFTLDTLKFIENKVSKNIELPQSNKFMEIEGGSEWN